MKVDTVAALQGIEDAKQTKRISTNICNDIKKAILDISIVGSVGRKVFDINLFFEKLAKIDFGGDSFEIASLVKIMGEAINSGLIVAQTEK